MNSQAIFTVGGIVLLLAASQAFGGLRGDMNNDGNRDGDDIQRFVEVLVSPFDATVEETCAADTSEDRLLTIEDVPPMVQLLLGLIPPQYAVRG
ncbi:MAG: hypothetical protein O7F76_10970, partial [Planctomycetota bacterium]|nr:hypothetical protein [Planctomycetota bacterium]